jgi:CDP-4-dehydro-6-deoxyglucose reductase, E1
MPGMICKIKAGTIYKIPFPFTNLTETKIRPALAVTNSDVHGDAQFLFITTTPPESTEKAIALDVADFVTESLPLQSYVRFEKSILLNESLAIKEWAQLTNATMARIYRAVIANEVNGFDKFGNTQQSFIPGQSVIPPSGKVIGVEERQLMVEASLDGWLTTGRFNDEFEKKLAAFIGVKHLITVNSALQPTLSHLAH